MPPTHTPECPGATEPARDAATGDGAKTREQLVDELRAARAAIASLRAVIERLPDATLECDERGHIAQCNHAALTLLGYASDAGLVGRPVGSLAPVEERAAFGSRLRARASGDPGGAPFEQRLLRSDGTAVVGEIATASVIGDTGPRLLLTIRSLDVNSAAHARLRMFEAAISQMRDMVFITEAESRDGVGRRIVFVNRAFCDMTGYRAEEVIGQTPNITVGSATDRDALKRIEAALRERRPVHEELQKYRKDGTPYWVEIDIVPVWDQAGRHTHWVSVQRDLTERHALQARVAVHERLAAVGTLAAGVAHEINNPLAYVMGNIEYVLTEIGHLRRGAPGDSQQTRSRLSQLEGALEDARSGSDRVRSIVRDLKLFSHSASNEVREPVDVRRILDSAVTMVSSPVRARGRLIREYGDVPAVLASEGRLAQVFINVLINALQALAPEKRSQNEIRIRVSAPDASVIVEIEDNGAGIPVEVRDRIFVPFFTTKPVGAGTGLGLSICHGIVTSLGGSIGFDSEVGRGTTFRIALPSTAQPAVRSSVSPRPSNPPGALPPSRVLLVDDDPGVAYALTRLLGDQHEIILVNGATAAREMIRSGTRFDVIFCDVNMPGASGLDLYQDVARADARTARRFIFMTGGLTSTQARDFLASVSNVCLEKPFDPQAVADALRNGRRQP